MSMVAFISPFVNDPFALVCQAYKNLYDKPFTAFFDQHEDDDHKESMDLRTLSRERSRKSSSLRSTPSMSV